MVYILLVVFIMIVIPYIGLSIWEDKRKNTWKLAGEGKFVKYEPTEFNILPYSGRLIRTKRLGSLPFARIHLARDGRSLSINVVGTKAKLPSPGTHVKVYINSDYAFDIEPCDPPSSA